MLGDPCVARKLKAIDVIDVLSDLFILRGVPAHIRSDNGPEFLAKAVTRPLLRVPVSVNPENGGLADEKTKAHGATNCVCTSISRERISGCRYVGKGLISQATFYCWKQLCGGSMPSKLKRLQQLEVE
jgi:hypothetical protein